jgi:serine/threonine protein kinase
MPKPSPHPTPNALTLFGRGQLSDAQAATVAAHLATCAACRQALASVSAEAARAQAPAATGGGTIVAAAPIRAREAVAAPAAVTDVPPELSDHPKFRIVRELGRGGMGVIYLAEHRVMEKPVALKVISPAVLDNPNALARFHAEVRAAGKLDHLNIARAYDADQAGDLHFLVMEYIEGVSLAQLLEECGPLPVGQACHYIRQAALGLQHAFEQGMAHRDIKPQNLMVTPQGLTKVLDFGLARMRSAQVPGTALTQADSFMGTPEYVAPEQATDARQADTRADIYSLGCTLFALLTGRPPFVEDTAVKLVLAHIGQQPAPVRELRPDVPPKLSAVVAKMLAKDPAERFQRPIEVAEALVPFIEPGVATAASVPSGGPSGRTRTQVRGATSIADKKQSPMPTAKAPREKGAPVFDHLEVLDPSRPTEKKTSAAPVWWKNPLVLAIAGGSIMIVVAAVAVVVVLVVAMEPTEKEAPVAVASGRTRPAAAPATTRQSSPSTPTERAAPPSAPPATEKRPETKPNKPAPRHTGKTAAQKKADEEARKQEEARKREEEARIRAELLRKQEEARKQDLEKRKIDEARKLMEDRKRTAASKLKQAESFREDAISFRLAGKKDEAERLEKQRTETLQQIVDKYSETDAAKEAKKLLEKN